jgi:hypothetical protein
LQASLTRNSHRWRSAADRAIADQNENVCGSFGGGIQMNEEADQFAKLKD